MTETMNGISTVFFMLLTHLEIAQQQEMFTQKEFESFLIVSIFFTFFRMLFSEFLKQWLFFWNA